MGAVTAATFSASRVQPQPANNFGGLNSAHEHAAFVIKINGTYLDFSKYKYQVKSPYIHVENGIGTTIHKHAINVPFGEFLRSINMNIDNGCFVSDDGKEYCQNGDMKLRFFLNEKEQPVSSITNYVLSDDDRFLIIYGNETSDMIKSELDRLAAIPIFKNL